MNNLSEHRKNRYVKGGATHQHPGAPFENHQYYTLKEAICELDISPQTMRKYIQNGDLIVRKLGGKLIVLKSDLGEFIINLPQVK